MNRRNPLLVLVFACSQAPHAPPLTLTPAKPLAPRTTSDSIVAAVLHKAVVNGLPNFRPRRRVVIRTDSGFVSAFSLPPLDSVEFVLLDSAQTQQLADQSGDLNVLIVPRPAIWGDTAKASVMNRWVWQQRRDQVGIMVSTSACQWRLRRLSGAWQIDSTLGCLIT